MRTDLSNRIFNLGLNLSGFVNSTVFLFMTRARLACELGCGSSIFELVSNFYFYPVRILVFILGFDWLRTVSLLAHGVFYFSLDQRYFGMTRRRYAERHSAFRVMVVDYSVRTQVRFI